MDRLGDPVERLEGVYRVDLSEVRPPAVQTGERNMGAGRLISELFPEWEEPDDDSG